MSFFHFYPAGVKQEADPVVFINLSIFSKLTKDILHPIK